MTLACYGALEIVGVIIIIIIKQNRINVWLYNYLITTCSQSYNENV